MTSVVGLSALLCDPRLNVCLHDETVLLEAGMTAALTARRLAVRSRCLAIGLQVEGAKPGDVVGVCCCAEHADDLLVAISAILEIGATPQMIRVWPSARRPDVAASSEWVLVLACEEGDRQLASRGVTSGVVADAARVGVVWWKAVECRGSRVMRRDKRPADASEVVARLVRGIDVGRTLTCGTGAEIVHLELPDEGGAHRPSSSVTE